MQVQGQELIGAITHLAFYAGPKPMCAMEVAKKLFRAEPTQNS